ncbi:torso-like protein [Ischnura elegans]|uniref:torso-like protein n=1 Tax=Ischnura elegans TaxID=197161 RepID=UPI001ED88AE5|nr:torso-like protein [Ischnura elegans]
MDRSTKSLLIGLIALAIASSPGLALMFRLSKNQGYFHPARLDLEAGEAINIFSSYGYLREGFHILPTNATEPWVIRMPTLKPLKDVPVQNDSLDHKGDIEFEFCSGPKQLLHAYFRHFSIDGIPRVWNSFLIGWDRDTFARFMGIKKHFLSNSYSYVLVRILRREKSGSLSGDEGPSLTDAAFHELGNITVGDEAGVLRFFEKHGTHYVDKYTTGGLMYQVYAYSRKKFNSLINQLSKKTVKNWPPSYFDFVFSPWFSDHSGEVMVASGNSSILDWMHQNLNASFFIYSHHSLLNVYRDDSLMHELATILGEDVIIELKLRTIVPAIKDEEKRLWVEEILMNRLALWEVGI